MALRNVTTKSRGNSLWILPPTPSPKISPGEKCLCSLFRYPDNYISEAAQSRTVKLVKGDLKVCYINCGLKELWWMWKRKDSGNKQQLSLNTEITTMWKNLQMQRWKRLKQQGRTSCVGVWAEVNCSDTVGESQLLDDLTLGQLCTANSHILHGPSRKAYICGQHP